MRENRTRLCAETLVQGAMRLNWTSIRAALRTVRRGWPVPAAFVWRRLVDPEHVVAVTGSCGKTTTTALIGEILSARGAVRIGLDVNTRRAVARSVLRLRRADRFLVQEVSGHQPGAIDAVTAILRHDVAVVTTIGSDHRKSFGSIEAIAREKGRLVEALPPTGVAILNADDPLVRGMAARTAARVVTFGAASDADLRLLGHSQGLPDRLTLTVADGDRTVEIRTRLVGSRWIVAVLAALACGRALGVNLDDCIQAIEATEPRHARDSVHYIPDGPVIVLDTMKAPLWTIPSSIEIVRTARAPRKTIIFGTISDYTGTSHRKYRDMALQALEAADRVLFVGRNSGRVWRMEDERLHAFASIRQARDFLRETVVPGELIYVKTSGIDHLERLLYDWQEPIQCWSEDCRRSFSCDFCKRLYSDRRTRRTGFNPDGNPACSGRAASAA